MLRRRWVRKQPPVAKELPEEGASVTIQSPENHSFRPLEITGSTSGEIQSVYREPNKPYVLTQQEGDRLYQIPTYMETFL
ncbi:hypothetical protein PIB30_086061 [Stylosanthes scabra]|uniref:Uncharacterized protein n=1 Tax=Stylosanthes scabra TaxID=79078 RepID=A0ABU6URU8_9FABA|nr:hypothetical protein [Stylosanthes scabra]